MKAEYYQCRNCGVIFQYPQTHDKVLDLFYRSYFRQQQNTEGHAGRSYGNFLSVFANFVSIPARRFLPRGSRLLDVGSGTGDFLSTAKKLGYRNIYAIEPFARLKVEGVNVIRKRCEELSEQEFPNQFFDTITLYHVLEHLKDPILVLSKLNKFLKVGGTLIIQVPSSDSLINKFFHRYSQLFASPVHMYLFSTKSLEIIACKVGLKVVKLRKIPLGWSWMASLKNRLAGRENAKILPFLPEYLMIALFELFEFLLQMIGKQAVIEIWLTKSMLVDSKQNCMSY